MMDIDSEFIRLSSIEQKTYKEISLLLNIPKATVSELWNKHKDARVEVNKVRTLYNRKGFTDVPFSEFYASFMSHERKCCYCGITQEEIDTLFDKKKVYTSRQVTRGKKLELERVLPKETYGNLGNLKLACYWCNNAKSDEFTEDEFKLVAASIAQIWKQRLAE